MTKFNYKLLCITLLFASSVYAESPCRTLAKEKAYDDPSLPVKADKETPGKILDNMHDLEIICSAIVQKIKTKNETPHDFRERLNLLLVKANQQFDKDGDIDALEKMKYEISFAYSSLDIAENYH
ncbi:hypothetical protein [Candidatus Pantoea multigeneris]|uniref:Uncharacterized protein n=1 Tax=Candidatus Pantoea multigeneris TaxID=2608357 RepID=A0ABX0RKB1_9GAMM|nr:hypothetical protein [Pantoea multigeneris]NIF24039.1 hypothetical protein [Pantoea multigeneris]